jgi:hypothetical protein
VALVEADEKLSSYWETALAETTLLVTVPP